MTNKSLQTRRTSEPLSKKFADSITGETFNSWYQEKIWKENIEEGTPFFNGPGIVQESERHRPSSLLKCHRKVVYNQLNAPNETPTPHGIFWVGNEFEEQLAVPFLTDIVENIDTKDDIYVANSLWIDFEVSTQVGDLRIKGETDPVIVDRDCNPILPTEIKTTSSLDHLDSPKWHHLAQTHAYLEGLSRKYDQQYREAVILYAEKTNLDVKSFHIEFDYPFWEDTVIKWAQNHTSYRLSGELPPAEPEADWECKYCDFRNRCGKSDYFISDVGPIGFIPKFVGYPKSEVVEYLESHPGAKLTPSLAHVFPELAEKYGSYDWSCSNCGISHHWEDIYFDQEIAKNPRCPACRNGFVSGPDPSEQYPDEDQKEGWLNAD